MNNDINYCPRCKSNDWLFIDKHYDILFNMDRYIVKCDECGHQFEIFIRQRGRPLSNRDDKK